MKLFLTLLVLTTAKMSFTFDLTAYKNQYQALVCAPFENAMTIYAVNIVEYLAKTPVPATVDGAKKLSGNLNLQVQAMNAVLKAAAMGSDGLKQQLDGEEESLMVQVSRVNKNLVINDQALMEIGAQIEQMKPYVAAIEAAVSKAQEDVQNAEKCFSIGGWSGHKICRNPDQARANLAYVQQRLAQAQAQWNQLFQRQSAFQQTKATLEANMNQLKAQHDQINQADINDRQVEAKLEVIFADLSVFSQSSSSLFLGDTIKSLIDIDFVIEPMGAITDLIISFTPDAADVEVLNSLKEKITLNLPSVQMKLPQYDSLPFNATVMFDF